MLLRARDYTFKKHLRVDPREHPILCAEPVFNTRLRRERTLELFFERFDVPAIFLAKDAVLAAFSHGRSTAMVRSKFFCRNPAARVTFASAATV